MFYLESTPLIKSASADGFSIDPETRRECEDIMSRIYGEQPGNWPYGLDIRGHDGGVWLVKQSSDKRAVGFVGWQERREMEEGKRIKVGYYSIGILPEYRGQGLAKAAISKLVRAKSASVDCVRAFIVPGNSASSALANSLGIPIVNDA